MDQPQDTSSPEHHAAGGRWTAEQRAAAFRAYYSSGSRRRARAQAGVPERTLSAWLRDPRYEDERQAVQDGLLAAVEQEAAERGAELAEATREALLVCRKALRRDPDGKTASALLSALTRARESEDRIRRLDHGRATEILGLELTDEDRAALPAWIEQRRLQGRRTEEEIRHENQRLFVAIVRACIAERDAPPLRAVLSVLASDEGALRIALVDDVALANQLKDTLASVLQATPESLPAPSPAPERASSVARPSSREEP